MKDLIKNIKSNTGIERTFSYVMDNIYKYGPVSVTDMEILSYLALYSPEAFENHKNAILNYMAVYYKETSRNTLRDAVFGQYRRYIKDTYHQDYTPVQADIIKGIANSNCFSFSAPTSTGKSFVFMNLIQESQHDIVVVVPSRALINEYYLKLSTLITDRSVNILTFIDKINTNHARKNVFVVTPERCRELFKQKDSFTVDMFLFDEAQLSNEDSKRGLYFDSIVRRCLKAFPHAKFVFAHPFVKNPGSQIAKNHFNQDTSAAIQYTQKNVGQLFFCKDKDFNFYHFGIDPQVMGKTKQRADFDPIEKTILDGGTALFYVSKAQIYNGGILKKFSKYVDLCKEVQSEKIEDYIERLKQYTGGDTGVNQSHYSLLLALLKRGIVIHHGSLPLQTRLIIEQFTKDGLCKICFATSTLEQGINMPFDVVFLDRMENSKPLSVKNLIGRAGRSSTDLKFDFGYVIINASNISNFRKIMNQDEELDDVSSLEKTDLQDEDFNEFKEAILNDTYSDEYNLSEKDLEKLTANNIDLVIQNILNSTFEENTLISLSTISADLRYRLALYANFREIYAMYLGRTLEAGEINVLDTAIKIILWKIHGKTFKNICWYRYSYASRSHERESGGQNAEELPAAFFTQCKDIPDKSLSVFSMFPLGTKAKDVSYDLVMYDTYDYIDKLIGFKLSDIFYATFIKYFERTADPRADRLAKYVKYGTDSPRFIWMLRYGLSFEDIEILDKHIDEISPAEIVFKNSISEVPDIDKSSISRFLN
ncbi:DEAD/DEAH box helicase [Mucilaginibacter sp. ZT4R22]|uniref:DEAD/DEAH box helicase n=1 Tax=Mucilaginibacter pankratovii TaxID=2772110 RepID=A0ABR7WSI5_9SPHI|nr:DEAD/DEAH box helicase [Mucilaginibacter pankratovii]MBD1365148.1 DEAD/DEAH box helicase [Mucilaginibacter pankratovii]